MFKTKFGLMKNSAKPAVLVNFAFSPFDRGIPSWTRIKLIFNTQLLPSIVKQRKKGSKNLT